MFLLLALKYFTPFSTVSIFDFEQVKVSLEISILDEEKEKNFSLLKKGDEVFY